MDGLTPCIARIADGHSLARKEMMAAVDTILCGQADEIEIAGFLAALRTKGETPEEIAAAAEVMREKALKVDAPEDVIDTCGTGGDGAGTYNISTATALILAGCGLHVAKHGNNASSSLSGSSQVLAMLGVTIDAPAATISRCIREAGIGYMHAVTHHGTLRRAAAVRKKLRIRTLFNILGPLANPAGASRQLTGVFSRELVEPLADVMRRLGRTSAWVVHGSDGLDELTTTGPSFVAELKNGTISQFDVTPEMAGLKRSNSTGLRGGDPAYNARALGRLLEGERGPYRDIAVLNAAAGLIIAGKADSLESAARHAETTIDNGAALGALKKLVAISGEKK